MKIDKVSKRPAHKLRSNFFKAVVWSFRLALETSRTLFATIVVCFAFEAIVPVASTATIGVLVGKFKDASSESPTDFETLALWLGLVILLLSVEFILTEVRTFSRLRLVDESGINLQKRMYQHTARMDLSFFEESETLNKLFRASSGGSGGAIGPIQSALAASSGMVQVLSLFGLMLYLQPLMATLLFVAGLPLLVIRSLSAIEKYKLDVRTTQRKRLGKYYTSRLAGEDNVSATKILNLATEMIERFEQTARSIVDEKKVILKKISIRLGLTAIAYLCVLLGVVGWLSYSFSQGVLEVGVMVAFMLAAFRTLKSMGQISNAMASGADSALSVIPVLEFLDVEPSIRDKGGLTPETLHGHLELENVSFAYASSPKNVLNNIKISIPAGQKVAIVGKNGAGKSTLSKLIARLYEVGEGSINIDGNDIRDLSLRWLHDHIAMVFQKPTQFEAPVWENIAFGDWERLKDNPEEVQKLAHKAGLTEFIEGLPEGFDTHLGRLFGETTLSQGQWQLLSVARALARQESILLFDEPTSSLDMDAEAAMFRAIRELAQDRTVIFISHRFTTVKEADRILVFDKGRLVGDGTHGELMKSGGFYAEMVNYQKNETASKE